MNLEANHAKQAAARRAMEYVQSGMHLGLGTGSSFAFFLRELAHKCRAGYMIRGVPSSLATEQQARDLGIPLLGNDWQGPLDLVVDGADEVDTDKNLIKGGGGALFREKMIAYHTKKMIVIVDESKLSSRLGKAKLPVEVLPFGVKATLKTLETLIEKPPVLRKKSDQTSLFMTDNGNYIADLEISNQTQDWKLFDRTLRSIPGVIETGLFLSLASKIIVGDEQGNTRVI